MYLTKILEVGRWYMQSDMNSYENFYLMSMFLLMSTLISDLCRRSISAKRARYKKKINIELVQGTKINVKLIQDIRYRSIVGGEN